MKHGESGAEGVCEKVRIREAVFLELRVENLDLKLEGSGIRRAPHDCFCLRHACAAEERRTEPREVVPAKCVAEFVLVTEVFVPVGVEEEAIGALAGPPRVPHVVVEDGVTTYEYHRHARAPQLNFGFRVTAIRWRDGVRLQLGNACNANRVPHRHLGGIRHQRIYRRLSAGRNAVEKNDGR